MIYIHKETCTYENEMVDKEETKVSKGEVMNIQMRLLLKSIAHSSNLSHCIQMNFKKKNIKCITHITKGTRDSEDALR